MESFVYTASPARAIFGSGASSKVPGELSRQELTAALVLCTPAQSSQASDLKNLLGSSAVGTFTKAAMHTPVEATDEALQVAKDLKTDSIVPIGGGSTIGLGKAISIRTGLPHVCVATTYAGSEMTPILGETAGGVKTTRRDDNILPGVVIYNVDSTLTLPQGLGAARGVNALAHAVEALYTPDSNPNPSSGYW